MSTFKRCKLVMLPTNEKANLLLTGRNNLYYSSKLSDFSLKEDIDVFQHLYFLSDEEIKEGDWIINLYSNTIFQLKNGYGVKEDCKYGNYGLDLSLCKKIIATTNKSLTINSIYGIDSFDSGMFGGKSEKVKLPSLFNLPQPSQSFIEKYVEEYNKGNVIKEVLVDYQVITKRYGSCTTGEGVTMNVEQLKISPKDNTITICKVKDSWNREEVEALILKFVEDCDSNEDLICYNGHIGGVRQYNEAKKWIEENV